MDRHFVTVGGSRQVHYRRTGSGPAVVILHESPLSSRAYIPLAQVLARSFTVIALDTPGFGSSDPLPMEHPEIEDFTAALLETLDALGVEKAAFYGAHTGACIGLELAYRHPQRVAGVVLDGLPRFTDAERERLLEHYTPRIEVRWDGTHLLQAFNQRRDMKLFFPWFDKSAATRQAITMPSPQSLHEDALDLIKAKDHYWKGYKAAFRYRVEEPVGAVTVPVAITARGDEILGAPDFPGASPAVRTELLPTERTAWAERLHGVFRELPAGAVPPAPPATTALAAPGAMTRLYLRRSNGELLARSWGGAGIDAPVPAGAPADVQRPLVLIHQSPFSGALQQPLATELARTRPVLLLDTPGYGDSSPLGAHDPEIGDYADAILDGLRSLGSFDLFGILTGSAIAAEIAQRAPARVRALALDTVPMFEQSFRDELYGDMTPEMPAPTGDGALFVWAWAFARDHAMWFPAYRQDPAHARPGPPPTPEHLHLRAIELLKTGRTYRLGPRAAFAYAYEKRLPRVATRTLVCTHPGSTAYAHAEAVAGLIPGAVRADHDGTAAGQAATVAAFLDGA